MATERVECPSDNKAGALPAMLTGDPNVFPAGIIVLQEWWGLNDQIQECGKEINAGVKALTLVPDLYRGKITTDKEEADHLANTLDWTGAIQDIRASALYLKNQGCKKVGVTGFCMGGALAFAGACLVPEIDAAVPFYGIPPLAMCDVTTIKVPLQCHFADRDETVGFAHQDLWRPLKQKLEEANLSDLEFYSYDTGHAFSNKSGPNYDKASHDLSFQRMFDFFRKHLD